jgi:hypothetical protein
VSAIALPVASVLYAQRGRLAACFVRIASARRRKTMSHNPIQAEVLYETFGNMRRNYLGDSMLA